MKYLFILIILTFCSSSELFEEYYKEAEEYMKNMTIEEKIGQMFFQRYYESHAIKDIKNKTIGGFILFAKDFNYNETYIKNYIKEMHKLSNEYMKLPLGIAVDEEGGTVVRVSTKHRKEGKFPSPQDIYNESGIEGILKIDKEKRDLLKKFYINVNLAPVADISYNSSDFIYNRTLGRGPNETTEYIAKDVNGYVNDNFTCCVKHFPGYGNNSDTHFNMTIDDRDYDIFLKEDLKPFEAAITNKVPMIMVSHNIVTCKDKIYPASLSKEWHNILRKDLNYTGLILTDDISMGAITKYKSDEPVAVLAVKSGNDIIETSNYYQHYEDVRKAVESGDIKEEIINKACRRIIAWKLKYLSDIENEEAEEEPNGDNQEEPKNYSTLIIVCSIFGSLIIIGAIIILIIYFKKKVTSVDIESVQNAPEIKGLLS